MPTIYIQDKIFGTLKEQELQTFLSLCDTCNLGYFQRDETSWQMLPQLSDTTLMIKPLEINPVHNGLIQNLKQRLTWHGAIVIVEPGPKLNSDLFNLMRSQIAIGFMDHGTYPDNYDMYFYYSQRAISESMDFIYRLVKQFSNKNNNLTYTLASYWKHLTCFKYRKILFSAVPTALIVFRKMDALEEIISVTDCIFNSIMDVYGKKISLNDLDKLAECINKATEIIPITIPDRDTPSQKGASTECVPNNVIEETETAIGETETTITTIESPEQPEPNTVSEEAASEPETIVPPNVTPENTTINSSALPKVEVTNKNPRKISNKTTAKPRLAGTRQNVSRLQAISLQKNVPQQYNTRIQSVPRSHTIGLHQYVPHAAPKSHTNSLQQYVPELNTANKGAVQKNKTIVPQNVMPENTTMNSSAPPNENVKVNPPLQNNLNNQQTRRPFDISKHHIDNQMTISLFNSQANDIISDVTNTSNRNTTDVGNTFYRPFRSSVEPKKGEHREPRTK